MSKQYALVIDDERDIRELLTLTLGRMGLRRRYRGNVAEARQRLAERHYALCFTDMRLPDGSGQEIVELIASQYPETPVAMITAYGNVDAAVNALKAGAFDFVSKPVDISVLRRLVQTALQALRGKEAEPDGEQQQLIGDSAPMQELRATISKLARSQAPVYISGESGVGKELVARLIHEQGPRAGAPFVPVNCGAIPSELMESEFFGHKKGSFTGAHADKDGLFQAAQRRHAVPRRSRRAADAHAGEAAARDPGKSRAPDRRRARSCRSTCASCRRRTRTSRSSSKLGSFRQDLFYRINVIELRVPPLRERREDIPKLAARVLERLSQGTGAPPARLAPDALEALLTFDFPGNVRELENVLERAVALCEAGNITAEDLRLAPRAGVAAEAIEPAYSPEPAAARSFPSMPPPRSPTPFPGSAAPERMDDEFSGDLAAAVAETERAAIMKALEATRWNRTAAAKQLGLTLRQLRYRLEKLGIE